MNQYDPMKGNASSNESQNRQEHGETYHTSDTGYTYNANHADDGQGYTNPDGSHGFIYNSSNSADGGRPNRTYRGAVIALSVILAAVVLGSCCLIGAFMAARSWSDRNDSNSPTEETKGGSHDAETSGGLIISDDKNGNDQDTGDVTLPLAPGLTPTPDGDSTSADSDAAQGPGGDAMSGTNQPPSAESVAATIQKLPPDRADADGDGKADIETDALGNVVTSAGQGSLPAATVVHRVAASVVEISTETIVQSGYIGQYISSGAGSGVIISDAGYVVTNHHVIDGANTITVRLNDGKEFSATLVGTDEETDIALLKIDPQGYALTVAVLGSSFDLVVGEDILAIGNPLGSLGGTVTEGMISATAREISVSGVNMTLLQVSAPINPGNSGGGLFNLAGELVGIVNAKMSSEEIEGLGFAVPIDTAYDVILELLQYGYVRGRPSLGFTVVDYSHFFDTYVTVYDNTHDVVQYGDIILAADNVRIQSVSELQALVRTKAVGDTMELIIQRNNRQTTVTITIVEKKP